MQLNKYLLSLAPILALAACAGSGSDQPYAQADQALADAGERLEGEGPCATVEQLPADCPTDILWRNHGQYVSCVSRHVEARLEAGDINETDAQALVREAAQSDVGKPAKATKHDNADSADDPDENADQDADDQDADDQDADDQDADDQDDPDYRSALPANLC